jgi:hypothetical protein
MDRDFVIVMLLLVTNSVTLIYCLGAIRELRAESRLHGEVLATYLKMRGEL